jgi:predicted TIM-barrel fold metal-dependent hydrolase
MSMAAPAGLVDCDVHVFCSGTKPLIPYLNDHWADIVRTRGIDRMELASYPEKVPFCSRPDWRGADGTPGGDIETMRAMLDRWGTRYAIVHCLHGAQALFSEDLGGALVSAVNDWIAAEWLSREPRLRASILVHALNPHVAAEEIERRAADKRFVQVLLMSGMHQLLGHRTYWPIYEAAERHGLPVGIHAGSINHHSPSPIGWPSTFAEDYANQSFNCQQQVLSMMAEGVFAKYPALKVVLMESGFAWVPTFLWRANKTWQGLRMEVPWMKQKPADVFREHVRITAQPVEAPPDPNQIGRLLEQIGSDEVLLFATDFPHWNFDGDDALPPEMPSEAVRKMKFENPYKTFSRLGADHEH